LQDALRIHLKEDCLVRFSKISSAFPQLVFATEPAETALTAHFALTFYVGHYNMVMGALNLIVAFVLAKVESGKDQEVLVEVKKLPGVRNVALTYGMYDLHVEVSFETMEALDNFVFDEIRRVAGIKETVTLIVPKVI